LRLFCTGTRNATRDHVVGIRVAECVRRHTVGDVDPEAVVVARGEWRRTRLLLGAEFCEQCLTVLVHHLLVGGRQLAPAFDAEPRTLDALELDAYSAEAGEELARRFG
jgi:hypothetical protein